MSAGALRVCIARVMPVAPSEYEPDGYEVLLPPAPLLLIPTIKARLAPWIMFGTESAVDNENSSISIITGLWYAISRPSLSSNASRVRLGVQSGRDSVTVLPC